VRVKPDPGSVVLVVFVVLVVLTVLVVSVVEVLLVELVEVDDVEARVLDVEVLLDVDVVLVLWPMVVMVVAVVLVVVVPGSHWPLGVQIASVTNVPPRLEQVASSRLPPMAHDPSN
jgi:hypothetical protein